MNDQVEAKKRKIDDADIAKVIASLAEISKAAELEAEREKNKPKFILRNDKIELDSEIAKIAKLQDLVEREGFFVSVTEDIEHKNVSSGSKFYIQIKDINDAVVYIELLEYKNRMKDWEFNDTEYIASYLSKITGDTSTKVMNSAKIVSEYLSCLIYFPELFLKVYSKIGWDNYNGNLVFKYDRLYSNKSIYGECIDEISGSLCPVDDNIEDKIEWICFTSEIMNYSVVDSLLLGAGISGIVRQLLPYTKETNLNINVVGSRASGKSTLGHYVLSIFGNPEKLEGSFTDTINKVDEIRAKRSVLPYILDERMLRVEDVSEKARKRTIIMDIFREYEGKVKERVGKQYDGISGSRTCGPIISSSVRSILDEIYDYADLGQFRRFIELKIKASDLFANKEQAERAELIASTCYGFGIQIIIEYMLECMKNAETIFTERFNSLNREISERLEKCDVVGIESSAMRFALVVLSYQVLRESIIYESIKLSSNNDIDESIFPDKKDDIIALLISNATNKLNIVNANVKERSSLVQYIDDYEEAFYEFEGIDKEWDDESPSKYIGKIKKGEKSVTIITKASYHIEQILFSFKNDLASPKQIKKYIECFEKNGKGPDSITMHKQLSRISEAEIDEFLQLNPWITLNGNINQINRKFEKNGKQTRAIEIILNLSLYEEGGVADEV